jgi:DNA-directed RNA polymerase specialized sigma24 family protein
MDSSFPQTPWSLIAQAAADGDDRAALLRQLLERYWQPVHRAIHFGWSVPEPRARELVSAFLHRMLDPALLAALDPEQTRFRDLIKAKLLEFMTEATRGLDLRSPAPPFELAELGDVPPSQGDPVEVFDEQWALLVIHRALERLKQATAEQQPHVYYVFEACDVQGKRPSDAELAQELSIDAESVQPTLQRARRLFRRFIAEEITQYAADQGRAQEELKWLLH